MIRVRDAHLHNLKHVDVDIPRGHLVAFTGVSGSGKSSLAFGTIHGEAQRRYLESVAPFARRLIASATDPQVQAIEGLPPSVALQQNTTGGGARSTVGTVSTVANTVRLLYSRCGTYPENAGRLYSDSFSPNTPKGMCPTCQGTGVLHEPTEDSMVPDASISINDGAIAAWPGAWAGKNFRAILESLGYPMDTPWRDIPQEDRDWILFTDEQPVVTIYPVRNADQVQRTYKGTWRSVASYLNKTLKETESDSLRKRILSFMEHKTCPTCDGRRLTREALQVTYQGLPIDQLNALPLDELHNLLDHEPADENERILLGDALPTIASAVELGLGHLSLDRPTRTLSAGELQRIRLATQLRTGLFGVVYVLDEPSAGLHPVEREAVGQLIRRFIDAGNSLLLVEHDMDLVAGCDWIVDIGPGAGERGGELLYSGPLSDYRADSPTHRALTERTLELNDTPRSEHGTIALTNLTERNLKDLSVEIGKQQLTAIAGVSGSGKSTLLSALAEQPDRAIEITQKPIGRTPRSCLATYTGLFDNVRKLFAKESEWGAGRFSFNNAEGQCPTCKGEGQIEVELVFLPGSYTPCPDCGGKRYNDETLTVTWHGHTIADILDLTVDEAVDVFADEPTIARAIDALERIGLGYLRLGQGAPELSGGEAQRIKLATELQRNRRGHTVYLMDEPTSGLHPADIQLLITEINRLVDDGHTVVVVEHDLSVLAQADRIIEMGPSAGAQGGEVIADGVPSEFVEKGTATARVLGKRAR